MRKGRSGDPVLPADEGVSPVVGMILVLAISVVGIATILQWGVPAIDEMKASVETKSVQAQFMELLADVQELEAGTAGKTAKRWQPSLQRGELAFRGIDEKWAFSWDLRSDVGTPWDRTKNRYNFTFAELNDTDDVVWIRHDGDVTLDESKIALRLYRIDGTLATEQVIREDNVSTNSQPANLDADADDWTTGETKRFYMRTKPNDPAASTVSLYPTTFGLRFDVYDDGELVAQAWLLYAGSVRFKLNTGGGERQIVLTNGGLMAAQHGAYAFLNSPPISPPKNTSTTYRFFGRVVQVNGTLEMGGDHRFDVLVNLYGTAGLVDAACASSVECAKDVKVYPMGKLAGVWRNYYLDEDNGYRFWSRSVTVSGPGGAGSDAILYLLDWQEYGMSLTLIQSVIEAES